MDTNTILIQLNDEKAIGFLHELEKKNWITVLEENIAAVKPKLSEKYRGIISKEDGQSLNEHLKKMRSEWSSI